MSGSRFGLKITKCDRDAGMKGIEGLYLTRHAQAEHK